MSSVELSRAEGAAYITLDRPEAGNAINMKLAQELSEVATEVASDPAVRCVVLTGAGRLFCAGGDVGDMAAAGDDAEHFLQALADMLHGAVVTLSEMPKPLVTLVNGPAAGAGLSLAILGDVVLAAQSAHFTAAYAAIGLTPDGGMSWLLPRLVGLRRAQSMILTNQRVSAKEAVEIGLITQVIEDTLLLEEGRKIIDRLVYAPTNALGASRGLIRLSANSTLNEHLTCEANTIAAAGARAEAREGVAAFLGRRAPDFRNTSDNCER